MEKYGAASCFEEQLRRIYAITETHTQAELAQFLGIRQSSISDAKKRQRIPSGWIVTLLLCKPVNPKWILSGNGPRFFIEHAAPLHEKMEPTELETQEILRRVPTRMLAEELLRRVP